MPLCIYCCDDDTVTDDLTTYGGFLCEICLDDTPENVGTFFAMLNTGGDLLEYVRELQSRNRFDAVRLTRERHVSMMGDALGYCRNGEVCQDWPDSEFDRICPSCGLIKRTVTPILPFSSPYHHVIHKIHKNSIVQEIQSELVEEIQSEFLIDFDKMMKLDYSLESWNSFEAIVPTIFYEAVAKQRGLEFFEALCSFQECYIQSFFAHHGKNGAQETHVFRPYGLLGEYYMILSLVMAARNWDILLDDIDRAYAYLNTAKLWSQRFGNRDCELIVLSELAGTISIIKDTNPNFNSQKVDLLALKEEVDNSPSYLVKYFYYVQLRRINNSEYGSTLYDIMENARNYIDGRTIESLNQEDVKIIGPSSAFLRAEISDYRFREFINSKTTVELRAVFINSLSQLSDTQFDTHRLLLLCGTICLREIENNDTENGLVYIEAYLIAKELGLKSYMFQLIKKLVHFTRECNFSISDSRFDLASEIAHCERLGIISA